MKKLTLRLISDGYHGHPTPAHHPIIRTKFRSMEIVSITAAFATIVLCAYVAIIHKREFCKEHDRNKKQRQAGIKGTAQEVSEGENTEKVIKVRCDCSPTGFIDTVVD